MSPYAEVLGHLIVLDGTIGEVLYRLREQRGQSQAGQCYRLRMSQYDFRRLENLPTPPTATFAGDVLAIARECNVGEPRLLLAMLCEGLGINGHAPDEASRVVGR